MTSTIFKEPAPHLQGGIYRALTDRPRVPVAQRSNFWRPTARLYEPLWRHRSVGLLSAGSFSTQRELELMLAWTRPRASETFLDAACATGLYARSLKAGAPQLTVHALDFSLPMLERARALANGDLVLVHGDVSALPYCDAVFDGVVCGGSPNEFLNLEAALREFARVLVPAGRLWLMYLLRAAGVLSRGAQRLLGLSGLRFLSPDELEQAAARAGLTLVRADYRGILGMALFTRPTSPNDLIARKARRGTKLQQDPGL